MYVHRRRNAKQEHRSKHSRRTHRKNTDPYAAIPLTGRYSFRWLPGAEVIRS
ncbi:hypothetical protein [Salimicrobium flavidum]|uniref:hypothetical protein n=1 Tax=Salimicrobium flavidum TaxID=570947 RepID=UPI00135642B0|nr:hypothetical protein [Salimicrobium flavidum]